MPQASICNRGIIIDLDFQCLIIYYTPVRLYCQAQKIAWVRRFLTILGCRTSLFSILLPLYTIQKKREQPGRNQNISLIKKVFHIDGIIHNYFHAKPGS